MQNQQQIALSRLAHKLGEAQTNVIFLEVESEAQKALLAEQEQEIHSLKAEREDLLSQLSAVEAGYEA